MFSLERGWNFRSDVTNFCNYGNSKTLF